MPRTLPVAHPHYLASLLLLGAVTLFTGCGGDDSAAVQKLKTLGVGLGYDENGAVNEVDFSGSKATDADVALLRRLPGVTTIYVGEALGDEGLEQLAPLKKLQGLDVSKTEVTYDGVKALNRLLPRCRIAFR